MLLLALASPTVCSSEGQHYRCNWTLLLDTAPASALLILLAVVGQRWVLCGQAQQARRACQEGGASECAADAGAGVAWEQRCEHCPLVLACCMLACGNPGGDSCLVRQPCQLRKLLLLHAHTGGCFLLLAEIAAGGRKRAWPFRQVYASGGIVDNVLLFCRAGSQRTKRLLSA